MFPSLRVSKTHALEGLPYETIVDLMTTGLTRVRLQRFSVGEQMFPMLLHLLLEKRACIGLQGSSLFKKSQCWPCVQRASQGGPGDRRDLS